MVMTHELAVLTVQEETPMIAKKNIPHLSNLCHYGHEIMASSERVFTCTLKSNDGFRELQKFVYGELTTIIVFLANNELY